MASADYFLKIVNIKGESSDSKHKGEIELESWSFGGTNSATFSSGSGGGSGKVSLQDFHFTKKVDVASVNLFVACATGQHLASAILTCRKAGGTQEEYLVITLTDTMVSSYQTGGHAGSGVVPSEQISLGYAKIEIKYKEQKPDGTLGGDITGGWDVKTNKKV